MHGVWPTDPLSHQGSVFTDVSVLQPMDEASDEICSENNACCLKGKCDELIHDPTPLTRRVAGDDIDSRDVSIEIVDGPTEGGA